MGEVFPFFLFISLFRCLGVVHLDIQQTNCIKKAKVVRLITSLFCDGYKMRMMKC